VKRRGFLKTLFCSLFLFRRDELVFLDLSENWRSIPLPVHLDRYSEFAVLPGEQLLLVPPWNSRVVTEYDPTTKKVTIDEDL